MEIKEMKLELSIFLEEINDHTGLWEFSFTDYCPGKFRLILALKTPGKVHMKKCGNSVRTKEIRVCLRSGVFELLRVITHSPKMYFAPK